MPPAGETSSTQDEAGSPDKGLRYVTDEQPGFTRVKRGKGFIYRQPDGKLLKDEAHLARIRSLVIPPAYQDVWICRWPNGHLQATGRDARGRKQYRYHPAWQQQRDAEKFERMAAFGQALPAIRRQVARVLAAWKPGAPVTRLLVLATIVRLLDTTLVRVGNESYRRANGSHGLTTLRDRHARFSNGALRLCFAGKSGVLHEVAVDDVRLARIVRRCQALPGHELFQYRDDDGQLHAIRSDDVNAYLREVAGTDYSAKDFRTWHATVQALVLSCEACAADGSTLQQTLPRILAQVACQLGNTPAVCRKSYVHPRVLALGEMLATQPDEAARIAARLGRHKAGLRGGTRHFSVAEHRLLAFLRSGACMLGRPGRRR
ncbi:MAG: DNA topoisomerase IB [Rubrivivax sp.]|nr:MAG: DNA topoisomerase IB [Rubrivivax sp.]